MVQSVDNNINRPVYNAVKINIKKPEVNAGNNVNTLTNDNGVYNAVNIDIDNPTVNTESKKIYDYPEAETPVTYEMANIQPVRMPQGFIAYHTTNVILPKMENELELEGINGIQQEETEETEETDAETEIKNDTELEQENENTTEQALITTPDGEDTKPETFASTTNSKPQDANTEAPVKEAQTTEVPAPNYTTVEAENKDNINDDVKVMEAETKEIENKKPEIIPSEEILPDVDIPLVVSNLTSSDFDTQALQMEEIARISLDNPENAVPYIVRDVFGSLIEISKKDSVNLAPPTDAQVEARKKVITNYIVKANAEQNNPKAPVNLPYKLTEKDFAIANELSPMELAERNKEYALYTMAILAKIYVDEVEKQTGNIVPMTDIPGVSAMVDSLRYSQNASVKVASIDALRHIQRPEYKEELTTLYTLAQADTNPQVAIAAQRAAEALNQTN